MAERMWSKAFQRKEKWAGITSEGYPCLALPRPCPPSPTPVPYPAMQLLIEFGLPVLAPFHLQPLHQGLDGQALEDRY